MDRENLENLVKLFEITADKFLYQVNAANVLPEQKEVFMHAPQIMLDYFVDGLNMKYGHMIPPIEKGMHFIYRGITLMPGYEWQIVIFHKDYPLKRLPWMILKVELFKPSYKTYMHIPAMPKDMHVKHFET
jgi:hypothetical protein